MIRGRGPIMKAITVEPGKAGTVRLEEVPELSSARADARLSPFRTPEHPPPL
jgi:hypothetical protein